MIRAVDGDERTRASHFDHAQLLVATRVTAGMYTAVGDPRAQIDAYTKQIAHQVEHGPIVARNDAAREDDHVSRIETQHRMSSRGELHERGHTLRLRAARDAQHALARQ